MGTVLPWQADAVCRDAAGMPDGVWADCDYIFRAAGTLAALMAACGRRPG